MDIAAMIMGASIASVAWIGFYPWSAVKRLRELEAAGTNNPDPDADAQQPPK
ncbi:hypothetical protein ACEXQD_04525 [Herbiconiux sp. P15]|uniref:hypothetical protein n=1 Tax=Herbiconiux liukaitaii TaxID=3342799 RepID=UPI0035B9497C